MLGEEKGRSGGLRLEGPAGPLWVVGSEPCVGSELPDVLPGSEETKSQWEEKGWRLGRGPPQKTSAQDSLEKEPCGGQERGRGRTCVGKC